MMASAGTDDQARMMQLPVGTTMMPNSLLEPVSVTILRDLKRIGVKLARVVVPFSSNRALLHDWDLWGPLLLCLTLASMLSFNAPKAQSALVFAIVFAVISVGAIVVTLNAQLLGGTLSVMQSVCVLGYCVFPMIVASLVSAIFKSIYVRLIAAAVCFIWATVASVGFLTDTIPPKRRALAVYPIFLFYLCLSWITVMAA
eukprot:Amastigsp_a676326_92.p2 type:complete len:200 gc:universal Amastigsp_a676326_92:68-667(+)